MTIFAAVAMGRVGAEVFPLVDYTPATLLGIGFLLLMFGGLVPWRQHKAVKDENALLRSSNANLETALVESVRQNGELLETVRLVRSVFSALEEASK